MIKLKVFFYKKKKQNFLRKREKMKILKMNKGCKRFRVQRLEGRGWGWRRRENKEKQMKNTI